MTYLLLNLAVLAVVLLVLWLTKSFVINKAVVYVLLILLPLTALFDSLIIMADIVAYDEEKILPFFIGAAPVEDFFYAIAVVILMPAIWKALGRFRANR